MQCWQVVDRRRPPLMKQMDIHHRMYLGQDRPREDSRLDRRHRPRDSVPDVRPDHEETAPFNVRCNIRQSRRADFHSWQAGARIFPAPPPPTYFAFFTHNPFTVAFRVAFRAAS